MKIFTGILLLTSCSIVYGECRTLKLESSQPLQLRAGAQITIRPLQSKTVIVRTKDQYGNQWMVDEVDGPEEFEFDEPVEISLSRPGTVQICQ